MDIESRIKNLEKEFKKVKIITTNDAIYKKIKQTITEKTLTEKITIYRAKDLM